MKIAVVLFDGFELLDAFGPVELLSLVPDWQVDFLSASAGHVTSSQGVKILVDHSWQDYKGADLVLVPGGRGSRLLVENRDFLACLRQMMTHSEYIASVCTGAALCATAGLFDGHSATTNKRAFDWAISYGPSMTWRRKARWVQDRNVWSSSGVSAGIDMVAAIIGDYS